jgi:hypothetical protein
MLGRLDQHVQALQTGAIERGEIEALHRAQCQQGGDAVAVRRTLQDGDAAIVDADGLLPLGAIGGEVVARQVTAKPIG